MSAWFAIFLISSIVALAIWVVVAMINRRSCSCGQTQRCIGGKCVSKAWVPDRKR